MKNQPITIVTAFFDIGRGEINSFELPSYLKRSTDTYFQYFENLASLNNEMIIFTSEEFKEKIENLRQGKPTKVIILNPFELFKERLDKISRIQNDNEFKKKVNPEQIKNIEYWSAPYVLITTLKPFFVHYAIKHYLVTNENIAWIDFGYIREESVLNGVSEWTFPNLNNKVNFFSIKNKMRFKIRNSDDVYFHILNNIPIIIGGVILAKKELWDNFYHHTLSVQDEFINHNIIDDDQGMFLMCMHQRPKLYTLNYLGKNKWFNLFKKFDATSKYSILDHIKDYFK